MLESQIECNRAIAIEGFLGEYGLNVGRALLEHANYGPYVRAAAMAASGSDARMSGCLMPVVINSGSGNQGLTVSLPVISLAESWDSSHEQLLRALLISNLVSVHVKRHIGRLSAYCGATSASSGVAAAATWLRGGSREEIASSVVNTLAVVSGMICDGAKASCAAKIAAALDSAFLAHRLAMQGKRFAGGDGIVAADTEETIRRIGSLGSRGMAGTDKEILRLMLL
ncbi:MAG: L-serine ammonia-lyase, iron-sulfur-dependent, subunit alpha [Oscillospiraceae bacterium]